MQTINRAAFTIGNQPIYWYGIVIAFGVVAAVALGMIRQRRAGFPKDTVIDFSLIAIPVSVIFARVYYVAFSWANYRGDLLQIFNIRMGGMAIYGGIIGGVLAAVFFARRKHISFWALADLLAPSVALGQAIGRWGNFFNQEAFGGAVESAAHQFFPLSVFIEATGQWHYAAFFYESVWCFLIVVALIALGRRFKRRGDAFLWYVLLYAAERAVVEGLRTDSLYWGSLRVSQGLSVLMMLAVCGYFFYRALRAGNVRSGVVGFVGVIIFLFGFVIPIEGFGIFDQMVPMMLALGLSFYLYNKSGDKPETKGGPTICET